MEQQIPTPTPATTSASTTASTATTTTTTASQPSDPSPPLPQPQQQQQQQQQPQPQPPPPTPQPPQPTQQPSSTPTPSPIPTSPNPNPNPTPSPTPTPTPTPTPNQNQNFKPSLPTPSQPQPQPPPPRPPTSFSRPPTPPPPQQQQQQQQPHFPHFSAIPSSSSPAGSPSIPTQRGGIAIGVPAHHPATTTSPQPAPFSSSFAQHFSGLPRTAVNVPESVSNSNAPQVRPTMQGMPGMGVLGSLGSSSQMRPGGIPVHHPQRPVQSPLRPPAPPTNQPSTSQNLQGHGLLRLSSVGSPGSPSPNTSQNMQSVNQPWLASGSQGKPPLPSPANRHQVNSQMQQRAHLPQQQHHLVPTVSQQQHMSSLQQQQPSPSNQSQEHYGQQFPPSRVPQALPHQQQITRVQGSGNQKPSSLAMVQPNTVQAGAQNRTTIAETEESCNRILSKRSIHELVSQVDSLEKLDPEVEEILVDIAEDFVDSITTFGCSLAKHRKSTTLEAKDILLHLERNWNMTLPGFGGDEIKGYRKPITNDIHKERLAAIKKSATETATKISSGQAGGNAKGNLAKTPANPLAPQT
ncbi:transcription initiation factor TFIID subunit 12 [Fagus crenata]